MVFATQPKRPLRSKGLDARRGFSINFGMDRIILQATLERAERFVSEGDHLIARQKELITEMLTHSLDVSRYEESLADFEWSQRLHIEHVRTLKQELSDCRNAF
jgi:hypothetical protein